MRGIQIAACGVAVTALVAGCTGPDDTTNSPSAESGTPATTQPAPGAPDGSLDPSEPAGSADPEPVEPSTPESQESTTPRPPEDSGSGCRGELTYADEFDYSLPQPQSGEFVRYDYASQIQDQSGGGLELVEIRAATHDGFDRFVAEYTHPHGSSGDPGLYAAYVECASTATGEEISIAGEDILAVSIVGASPRVSDGVWAETPEVEPPGVAITAIDYEEQTGGSHGLLLGVGHERADFRVFSLTDPTRVVVDVAHPD